MTAPAICTNGLPRLVFGQDRTGGPGGTWIPGDRQIPLGGSFICRSASLVFPMAMGRSSEDRVPHFYFPLWTGKAYVIDEVGGEFPDAAAAGEEAISSAQALAIGMIRRRRN